MTDTEEEGEAGGFSYLLNAGAGALLNKFSWLQGVIPSTSRGMFKDSEDDFCSKRMKSVKTTRYREFLSPIGGFSYQAENPYDKFSHRVETLSGDFKIEYHPSAPAGRQKTPTMSTAPLKLPGLKKLAGFGSIILGASLEVISVAPKCAVKLYCVFNKKQSNHDFESYPSSREVFKLDCEVEDLIIHGHGKGKIVTDIVDVKVSPQIQTGVQITVGPSGGSELQYFKDHGNKMVHYQSFVGKWVLRKRNYEWKKSFQVVPYAVPNWPDYFAIDENHFQFVSRKISQTILKNLLFAEPSLMAVDLEEVVKPKGFMSDLITINCRAYFKVAIPLNVRAKQFPESLGFVPIPEKK